MMKIILALTLLLLSVHTQAEYSDGCKSCSVHKHVHPKRKCDHCGVIHPRKTPRNPFKMHSTREEAGCDDPGYGGFRREEKDGMVYVSNP